jgi:anti-sigma factor RsiW
MNALTCHDVEQQLDLLAADECDRPTRSAVEQHLEACPACAARYTESRRLIGLLDLHWDAAGPEHVRRRIERGERQAQRGPVILIFVRQTMSLAALLLVTFGLGLLAPRGGTDESRPALHLSAQVVREDGPAYKPETLMIERVPADVARVKTANEVMTLQMAHGQIGAAFRDELLRARLQGKLPSPPAVPIALDLKNDSARPLSIRLGDAATRLTVEVHGPGVLRVPATGAAEPEFLRRRVILLGPGEHEALHIDRLVSGSRDGLEYIYLTEPGEYTLTASLRVTAGGTIATVVSPEVRVKVGN